MRSRRKAKGVGNLDAGGGIKHGDGPVQDAECPLHLQSEIDVSCSETVTSNASGFTSSTLGMAHV